MGYTGKTNTCANMGYCPIKGLKHIQSIFHDFETNLVG